MTTQHKPDPLPDNFAYSDAVCRRYFGPNADAVAASRLYREHRGEYNAIHDCAQARGLVGPSSHRTQADVGRPKTKVLTGPEIAAREKYSRGFCKALLTKGADTPGESLAEIKKKDPARYAELHLAMLSHNLITEREPQRPRTQPTPKTEEPNDGLVALPKDLAAKLGVDPTTRISSSDLATLLDKAAREQAAASSQVILEAHRVVEKEKDTLAASIKRATDAAVEAARSREGTK